MPHPWRILLLTAASLALLADGAAAQRYDGLSSPPTAPPLGQTRATHTSGVAVVAPVSAGLGAIEFFPVNESVTAPQSLVRQLSSGDERTRSAALTALGAPLQYIQHGHVPFPHSTQLEMAPLSTSDDQDALITIELDHHVVTSILVPVDGEWHRVATLIFPTAFADPSTTPSTFLRTTRSLLEPLRYRAVFRARENQSNGDYTENEAHLRVLNNRAIITSSFVDESRECTTSAEKVSTCQLTRRWLQPDMSQNGVRRFEIVTATGTFTSHDPEGALDAAHDFQFSHLRSYSCQPFTFSESSLRYEPTAASGPCRKPGSH